MTTQKLEAASQVVSMCITESRDLQQQKQTISAAIELLRDFKVPTSDRLASMQSKTLVVLPVNQGTKKLENESIGIYNFQSGESTRIVEGLVTSVKNRAPGMHSFWILKNIMDSLKNNQIFEEKLIDSLIEAVLDLNDKVFAFDFFNKIVESEPCRFNTFSEKQKKIFFESIEGYYRSSLASYVIKNALRFYIKYFERYLYEGTDERTELYSITNILVQMLKREKYNCKLLGFAQEDLMINTTGGELFEEIIALNAYDEYPLVDPPQGEEEDFDTEPYDCDSGSDDGGMPEGFFD